MAYCVFSVWSVFAEAWAAVYEEALAEDESEWSPEDVRAYRDKSEQYAEEAAFNARYARKCVKCQQPIRQMARARRLYDFVFLCRACEVEHSQ